MGKGGSREFWGYRAEGMDSKWKCRELDGYRAEGMKAMGNAGNLGELGKWIKASVAWFIVDMLWMMWEAVSRIDALRRIEIVCHLITKRRSHKCPINLGYI